MFQVFQEITHYTRGGEHIYYDGSHGLCMITGRLQNQLLFY